MNMNYKGFDPSELSVELFAAVALKFDDLRADRDSCIEYCYTLFCHAYTYIVKGHTKPSN